MKTYFWIVDALMMLAAIFFFAANQITGRDYSVALIVYALYTFGVIVRMKIIQKNMKDASPSMPKR